MSYSPPDKTTTKENDTMSDEKPKSKLAIIITAVIALVTSALGTHREDEEKLTKLKTDYDAKIAELQATIAEYEGDEATLEDLQSKLNDLLVQAAAARPPTQEHLDDVKLPKPEPVETGEQAPVEPPPVPEGNESGGEGLGEFRV